MAKRTIPEPAPVSKGQRFREAFADTWLPYLLYGVAFATSFGHLVAVAQRFGATGWERYTGAISVDLWCYFCAREMRRDKKHGYGRRWGLMTAVALGLAFGVCLTIAGNWLSAGSSIGSRLSHVVPATIALFVVFLMERRDSMAARKAAGTAGTGTAGTAGTAGTGTAGTAATGTAETAAPVPSPPQRPGTVVDLRPHTHDALPGAKPGTGHRVLMPPPIRVKDGPGAENEIVRRLAEAAVQFETDNPGSRFTWDMAQETLACNRSQAGKYLRQARPVIEKLRAGRDDGGPAVRAVPQ